MRAKNSQFQTELHPDSIPWEEDFPLERLLFPPVQLCRAERKAAGTIETLAVCHPPAAPHGWSTGSESAAAKPCPCHNRCHLQSTGLDREHLCSWNRILPMQLLPQREGQQKYLDPGTGTSASSGLRQPPAHPVTHALCFPVSYSSLCSAQHPAFSSLSWLLLPSHCRGDKRGWDGKGQIFFKAQQLPLHCCSWDRASPSDQHFGRSSTQLKLHRYITLHSKTDRFYYWIMTDFGFGSSVSSHYHPKQILSHKKYTKATLRSCQCWPLNS